MPQEGGPWSSHTHVWSLSAQDMHCSVGPRVSAWAKVPLAEEGWPSAARSPTTPAGQAAGPCTCVCTDRAPGPCCSEKLRPREAEGPAQCHPERTHRAGTPVSNSPLIDCWCHIVALPPKWPWASPTPTLSLGLPTHPTAAGRNLFLILLVRIERDGRGSSGAPMRPGRAVSSQSHGRHTRSSSWDLNSARPLHT